MAILSREWLLVHWEWRDGGNRNDSESEEEEEDPEKLVMIDESDNEGGNISGMDTEPEV